MGKRPEVYMLRATIVSLCCNIVLVTIKITALMIVNSLAIAIDLGISFVGLAVSVILYYSIKLANRPADLIHNYGYGKVEHVCEAMEGVVLIGIAFAMSSQAVLGLLHPTHVALPWVGFASSIINASINFAGSSYIFIMARRSRSPAIRAEGVHYRMEGFISGMIAVAFIVYMFLSRSGLNAIAAYVDPMAALLVSMVLVVPSFRLAKGAFFKLLDTSVEEDSQMEILKQLTRHMGEFCEFRNLRTRTAGRHKFVEFNLIVPETISFKEGYKTISELERDIKASIPSSEVMIKMSPCNMDCDYVKKGQKCPYL